MPRDIRKLIDGAFYHVLNRGNAKQQLFHERIDFSRFLDMAASALEEHPVDIFAYCIMPNHFHFVVSAIPSTNISDWVHQFMTKHVLFHRNKYQSSGHIWQGRFKDFPIQNDDYLCTVIRYVERNPVRSGLVRSAVEWRWSSLYERVTKSYRLISDKMFVEIPKDAQEWIRYVDRTLTEEERMRIRTCIKRQAPFGDSAWIEAFSKKYGLEKTIRPRGRPKKINKKGDCPHFEEKGDCPLFYQR